jgi:hypothetical protein
MTVNEKEKKYAYNPYSLQTKETALWCRV